TRTRTGAPRHASADPGLFADAGRRTVARYAEMNAGHNVDDGVSVEIWKVGILDSWNIGFHHSIIPLLHYSSIPSKEVTHAWSSPRLARDRLYPRFEWTFLHDAARTPRSGDHQDRAAERRPLSPFMDAARRKKGCL